LDITAIKGILCKQRMNKLLKETVREACAAVLPVSAMILAASLTLVPMPAGAILMFIVGVALLVVGTGFFAQGMDMAMTPMGEDMGALLTKINGLPLVLAMGFVMGLVIAIAEPNLQALVSQAPSAHPLALILGAAVGAGLFLALAILRILFAIRFSLLLLGFYALVFLLAIFVPANFIPTAFDAGGIATGAMTAPFILALGTGLASARADKNSREESFGLLGLCGMGPVLATLLLGIILRPDGAGLKPLTIPEAHTSRDVMRHFVLEFPHYIEDVFLAFAIILVFFIIFQILSGRYEKRRLGRILMGFACAFIGLTAFLAGANLGFVPTGYLLGELLVASSLRWILVPLSIPMGYFITAAEPAVRVFTRQVEDVSQGAVSKGAMKRGLSIGMAAALFLAMIRILSGLAILWFLIPGCLLALILSFYVPKIFIGIAFDSGGVCSGPMTAAFLLPLAMGACQGLGGDVLRDAFGTIAMVAMTPPLVVLLMGLVHKRRLRIAAKNAQTPDQDAEAADTFSNDTEV
jgi:hypothetical protein